MRPQPYSGLSPLARGNLAVRPPVDVIAGSIPARAGEPPRCHGIATGARVYPRSRGGTLDEQALMVTCKGLSPLARGNHDEDLEDGGTAGSIPARAGEPARRGSSPRRSRVYPRSRGGTTYCRTNSAWRGGLSPLARGNPVAFRGREAWKGSIPARAGEPARDALLVGRNRVYPRSRGGTIQSSGVTHPAMGLSPLARGNLRASVRVLG